MSPTTRLTCDANDFVNAENHAREKPMLAGELQHRAIEVVLFIGRIKSGSGKHLRRRHIKVRLFK